MNVFTQKHADYILPSVATIGFFDGVHRGHHFLIEQVKRVAYEKKLASTLITFPIQPKQVLVPDFKPALLSTFEEKIELLQHTGADQCLVLPFTQEFSKLTAKEFMSLLKTQYRVEALVVGHDHRFGHKKSEGFEDYVRYGKELGISLILAEPLFIEEVGVSSSLIRKLVGECRIEQANRLLGHHYRLKGKVMNGYKVGRTIGFPTANLETIDTAKLCPADGVYAVFVWIDGMRYKGMLDIGYRPTIQNGTDRTIEVHIIDFDRDIYGRIIELEFVKYMRADIKFDTIDELVIQLEEDKRVTINLLDER